jgi:ABC-type transporter lipoprotein component MlaA
MRPDLCSRASLSRTVLFPTVLALPVLALILMGLSGCATKPPADDPEAVAEYQQTNDPLEPTNRVFYAINNGLDTVILRPAAQAYRYVVPDPDNDFGMTLASWGVPEGPFLFLPVLGPSGPRDAVGFGVDMALDPFTWIGNPHDTSMKVFKWTRFGMSAIDARERVLDPIDQIKKTALDPYATFRSLYRQHRRAQIKELSTDDRVTVPVWFPQPAASATK